MVVRAVLEAERIGLVFLNWVVVPRTSILPPPLRKAARSAAMLSLVSDVPRSFFLAELRERLRAAAGWRVWGLAFVDIASPVGTCANAWFGEGRLAPRALRAQRSAIAGVRQRGR